MTATFRQIVVLLGILQFQFVLQEDDRTVKVTEELLRQHEEQRSQEMAWLMEMERKSQEMPWLLEMEESSQEMPEHESLLLLACQHWWFWASAEMLLMLFGVYWLPRQGSSDRNSSACGETPAVPRRKRKRRRRRRKRMHGTADYGDKLDHARSPDPECPERKDMQNSEKEGMKGMINASAKPFPQETLGQSCIEYTSIRSLYVFTFPKPDCILDA